MNRSPTSLSSAIWKSILMKVQEHINVQRKNRIPVTQQETPKFPYSFSWKFMENGQFSLGN